MAFYSFELILAGIILLSAMAAGGVKLWLNKRQAALEQIKLDEDSEQNN